MKYRVGVDVGGTFTDLVSIDQKGEMKISKISSTPEDSSIGMMNSIRKARVNMKDATFFSHGATVGANTIIEKKGVKTAIVTTQGFGDLIEIRKGARAPTDPLDMYDLQMDLPQDYAGGYNPLVENTLRFEVPERVDYKGNIVKPLDESAVKKIARELRTKEVKAIAICYLFSFVNPKHEQRTAEILREMLPGVCISISSEILPVIREYERLSTTTLNAYIMPIMQAYFENLRQKLASQGFTREYYIMQSSGGIISSHLAGQRPIYTIDSGPAGGVSAAADLGNVLGYPDIIAFDMGGTTTKVCVVRDGKPAVTTEFWADGKYFSGAPIMDMVEIGAGGGSIVWTDASGSVHVGPRSAGANPGPACYKLGGLEPTITDAIMTLGYLNPDYFLGGDMKVDIEASRSTIKEKVADKLGMSLAEAAHGIYRLAVANMVGAIRVVTVQRGYDPRDFSMVVFGGTGAVHAVRLAQELHIPKVIVPMAPGCFSALGLITSDAKYFAFRSYVSRASRADINKIQDIYREMDKECISRMEEIGFKKEEVILKHQVAMRYVGQAHDVTFEVPIVSKINRKFIEQLKDIFHQKHQQLFGHSSTETDTEFVTLSAVSTVPMEKPQNLEITKGTADPKNAFKGNRKVYFEEYSGYVDCPTYERSLLKAGNVIIGPAIIEQMDTTIVIPPENKAKIEKYGNVIIDIKSQDIKTEEQ